MARKQLRAGQPLNSPTSAKPIWWQRTRTSPSLTDAGLLSYHSAQCDGNGRRRRLINVPSAIQTHCHRTVVGRGQVLDTTPKLPAGAELPPRSCERQPTASLRTPPQSTSYVVQSRVMSCQVHNKPVISPAHCCSLSVPQRITAVDRCRRSRKSETGRGRKSDDAARLQAGADPMPSRRPRLQRPLAVAERLRGDSSRTSAPHASRPAHSDGQHPPTGQQRHQTQRSRTPRTIPAYRFHRSSLGVTRRKRCCRAAFSRRLQARRATEGFGGPPGSVADNVAAGARSVGQRLSWSKAAGDPSSISNRRVDRRRHRASPETSQRDKHHRFKQDRASPPPPMAAAAKSLTWQPPRMAQQLAGLACVV